MNFAVSVSFLVLALCVGTSAVRIPTRDVGGLETDWKTLNDKTVHVHTVGNRDLGIPVEHDDNDQGGWVPPNLPRAVDAFRGINDPVN
ncbi:hypothetical protein B0H12DRAFT_1126986 [Mycena haematopus]|nr:hypothetical protein B0H12DRAFT_1162595 [Mycena haematopus]KAJ7246154.1 hypothetical protein B0H12DRAFT_1126986 [Mycena haematopus]